MATHYGRIALILVLLFTLYGGYCAAAEPTGNASPDQMCNLQKLETLIGTMAISLGIEPTTDRALQCIAGLWKKRVSGSASYTLSNSLLAVMETNPKVFLLFVSKDDALLAEWLENLPNLSFTWPHDPPCDLEDKRLQLITLLAAVRMDQADAERARTRIVARLRQIRCRQID